MIKFFFPILFILLCFSVFAQQENNLAKHYVSDDLYTFMHSGPGNNYRILGSVQAGSKIQLLSQDGENGYSQITDDRGRTGWIESKFISDKPGLRERIPDMEAQLANDDEETQQMRSTNDRLTQQVKQLTTRNRELETMLQNLQQENQQFNQQLNEKDNSVQIAWLTRGGVIALGGIILGVIIAYLPKKRRRGDRWM